MTDHNWCLRWDGSEYHRDDLTVRHARVVSELIGDDSWAWVELDPSAGPLAFVAVLTAFIVVEDGLNAEQTRLLVEQLSGERLTDLLAAFESVT